MVYGNQGLGSSATTLSAFSADIKCCWSTTGHQNPTYAGPLSHQANLQLNPGERTLEKWKLTLTFSPKAPQQHPYLSTPHISKGQRLCPEVPATFLIPGSQGHHSKGWCGRSSKHVGCSEMHWMPQPRDRCCCPQSCSHGLGAVEQTHQQAVRKWGGLVPALSL